jgi:hypothetical protein
MSPVVTMRYLDFHWGDAYSLSEEDGSYTARAKFGARDVLTADSPAQLYLRIRAHYPGGASADLSST